MEESRPDSWWPSLSPAFIASLVEFVEALTIVLAVGTTRGCRSTLAGTAAGVLVLVLLVAAFGPALTYAPLQTLQIVLGVLLIFFGLRWLRKASLRYAGAIPMGDEAHRFAHTTSQLGACCRLSKTAHIRRSKLAVENGG